MAPDLFIEDRQSVIIRRTPKELSFGYQPEPHGGHLSHHYVTVDPVQPLDLAFGHSRISLMVENEENPAGLQCPVDGSVECDGVYLAILADLEVVIILRHPSEIERLARLCRDLQEESFLAREGYRLAMRGLLALIAIEVARLAASRARTGMVTLAPADATVEALRRLVEEHFRKERLISFYADKLAITPDRLNDHVKRVSGVTAGHLIRQRVLTEAKRALVFTGQPIHEVSYDLGFADPSHFARFFRKQTGMTPQEFREGRGG